MANINEDPTPVQNDGDKVGEGNTDADRRYREATERYVQSGKVDPAAKEARRAVDNPGEREDLKKAEELARRPAEPQSKSR